MLLSATFIATYFCTWYTLTAAKNYLYTDTAASMKKNICIQLNKPLFIMIFAFVNRSVFLNL